MNAQAEVMINSSKEKVWQVITDIENSQNNISGINSIEVLNKPEDTLVGLKWKEARTMFGKEAFETMWITHATENEYYQTRAESHGAIYISKFNIEPIGDQCKLTMSFDGQPEKFFGKLMGLIFGKLMMKSTLSAIQVDLEDIKKISESM